MALHEEIKASLKEAMKAKEAARLRTIRSMLTAFTNEAVASGKTPQDMIDDEAALIVIKRLAKQRQESIEHYEKAGRTELAEPEKEELEILQDYLPAMMSKEEIKPIAKAKLEEMGVTDKSGMGKAIGALMQDLKGKADGGDVKAVVEEILG